MVLHVCFLYCQITMPIAACEQNTDLCVCVCVDSATLIHTHSAAAQVIYHLFACSRFPTSRESGNLRTNSVLSH